MRIRGRTHPPACPPATGASPRRWTRTRNALCYILNNWRHHPRGGRGPLLVDGKLDFYASGILFPGWKEKTVPEIHIPPDYERPPVCSPRSWLLKESWKRAKPISCFEVPG